MKDVILAARIDALERHLSPPEAPEDWPQTFPGAHVSESIWLELTREMTSARDKRARELQVLRDRLARARRRRDLEELWDDYAKVYDASQDIFRESREILGGLAFREKDVDDALLCRIAEDVVLDCNRYAGTTPSLPLPGPEVLSRTLSRVVRMRLPEWTLWTLPMVAREYGQVLLDDLPVLVQVVEDEARAFAAADEGVPARGPVPDEVLERARAGLRSLVADGFAAYVMGPAYGYALVTLSLNPADRRLASRLRVDVVRAVLERMPDDQGEPAFAKDVDELAREWRELSRRVVAGRASPMPRIVDALADAVAGEHEISRLRYPVRGRGGVGRPGTHGHTIAQGWADAWLAPGTDDVDVTAASSIRDVLNAAWIARIEVSSPGDESNLVPAPGHEQRNVEGIEQAALDLCRRVMALHAPPSNGAAQGRDDRGLR